MKCTQTHLGDGYLCHHAVFGDGKAAHETVGHFLLAIVPKRTTGYNVSSLNNTKYTGFNKLYIRTQTKSPNFSALASSSMWTFY